MSTEKFSTHKKDRQYIDAIYWGGVFLWAGLVFGAESMGLLPQIGAADAWSWVFLGAGIYGLLGGLYRLTVPELSSPSTWDWVWSCALSILGLGGFTTLEIAWPLVLLLVGAVILGGALMRSE